MITSEVRSLAVVTGAAGGIGSVIAHSLAEAGWDIALVDYQPGDTLLKLVEETRNQGIQAEPVIADIGSEAEVESLYQTIQQAFNRSPDLLINNAAVQTWKPLLELSLQEWERTLRTNLTGCFLNTQYFAKEVVDSKKPGVIVNIGSGCNKLAFPNLVDYAASKGGIEMFTKTAALELGPHNIRVNCIAPGAIETDRTRQESETYSENWAALTPLRRVGQPADIAQAVLLLADAKAGFITGQTIGVDGGLFSRAIWPDAIT